MSLLSFLLGSTACTLLATLTTAVLLATRKHTRKIWRAVTNSSSNLGFSPTHLSGIDVAILFAIVISKSVLRLVGVAPKLRPAPDGEGFVLPRIDVSAPLRIEGVQLKEFELALRTVLGHEELIGATSQPEAPSEPSLLLAAQTTPLMLLTVAHYVSPILPFGAVNVRNRFDFLDREKCGQLEGDFSAIASCGGTGSPGRRTKRGIEFDIMIEVYDKQPAGEVRPTASSRSSTPIFRQIVTIMQTLPKHTMPLYKVTSETAKVSEPTLTAGSLARGNSDMHVRVPVHAPSTWARVCRDYNPIHMSAMAGRLLGLPGRIAHGNHVAAAALNLLQRRPNGLPNGPWTMSVAFRRPMVVPIDLDVRVTRDDGESEHFCIARGDKVFVEGDIRPLQ